MSQLVADSCSSAGILASDPHKMRTPPQDVGADAMTFIAQNQYGRDRAGDIEQTDRPCP